MTWTQVKRSIKKSQPKENLEHEYQKFFATPSKFDPSREESNKKEQVQPMEIILSIGQKGQPHNPWCGRRSVRDHYQIQAPISLQVLNHHLNLDLLFLQGMEILQSSNKPQNSKVVVAYGVTRTRKTQKTVMTSSSNSVVNWKEGVLTKEEKSMVVAKNQSTIKDTLLITYSQNCCPARQSTIEVN